MSLHMPNGQSNIQQNPAYQRYSQQNSAQYQEKLELSASQQNAQGQTIQVSASVSNTVSISGYSTKSHTFVPNGVEKYQAIQEEQTKPTQAASNILNFIAGQLAIDAADGASAEDIESRLAAGYAGFMQGYSEAAEILAGSNLLTPEIEADIQKTYDDVLNGIAQLAEKYGVASPVGELPENAQAQAPLTESMSSRGTAEAPAASISEMLKDMTKPVEDLQTLLQSTELDYEAFEKKSFSFELRTQDGDVVTITASAEQNTQFGYTNVNYADQYSNVSARGIQMENSSKNAFNFSVQGELDEGELGAIGDLLNQIGNLSETFFSGNITEAFDLALELGFDGEEIAMFSLNLKHETYEKLDNSYGSVQQMQPQEELQGVDRAAMHFKHLARFVQMLEDARLQADSIGMQSEFIAKVAEKLGQNHHAEDQRSDRIGKFVNDMVGYLKSQEKTAA